MCENQIHKISGKISQKKNFGRIMPQNDIMRINWYWKIWLVNRFLARHSPRTPFATGYRPIVYKPWGNVWSFEFFRCSTVTLTSLKMGSKMNDGLQKYANQIRKFNTVKMNNFDMLYNLNITKKLSSTTYKKHVMTSLLRYICWLNYVIG